tara:strand:- start:1804 stop:2112 length:309 start_codon:yes stop_codon:yes gene_type:complete
VDNNKKEKIKPIVMSKKDNLKDKLDVNGAVHRLLTDLDFTKCENGKYRRCMIHDSMHVKIDEYGYMYVFAELDMMDVKIPITCIEPKNKDKFKDWLLFTYGV